MCHGIVESCPKSIIIIYESVSVDRAHLHLREIKDTETFFPSALLKPPSQCLAEGYSLGTAYWVGVFKCFVHTAQERRLQKRKEKKKTLLQLEIKWIGQRSWKSLQYPHTIWTPRSSCTWTDTLMLTFKVRQHLGKLSTFHCPSSQRITTNAQRVCLGQVLKTFLWSQ